MRKLIKQLLLENKLLKIIAILATLIVIYLSLKPPESDSEPWSFFIIRGDLLLHFICYFGLTIFYYLALFSYNKVFKKAFVLSLFVGFILEVLQLIPKFQRFFDVQDLIANFFGATVGIFLIKLLFSDSIKD